MVDVRVGSHETLLLSSLLYDYENSLVQKSCKNVDAFGVDGNEKGNFGIKNLQIDKCVGMVLSKH